MKVERAGRWQRALQLLGPVVAASILAAAPVIAADNTTAGTATALVSGCAQITVSAPFTGDANGNGSVLVEYNTTNSWPGTTACGAIGGPSPRMCLVTGLNASTAYYIRATYSDLEGVSGVAVQVLPGTYTTTACSGQGGSPMILFLTPARDAVVGGTNTTFQVQIYGPDSIAPASIFWGLDGASPTNGVTKNANYGCNIDTQTNCGVYEFTVDASALSAGSHYVTVKATDSKAIPAVGQASWPFRVKNLGTGAQGAGNLLRRTHGSQLCLDCHSLPSHSSQSTSFKYGSWAMDCQTCHTPHLTTNIYLIRPSIQTPNSGSRSVDFRYTTGVADYSFATPQASGNGVNVCEICHTKTKNSDSTPRARNNAATDWTKHYSGDCRSCHKHTGGFAGGGESGGNDDCLGCHQFGMAVSDSLKTTTYHHVMEVGNNRSGGLTVYPTSATPTVSTGDFDKTCVQCHADHNVFRPDVNTSNTLGRGANLRSRIANGPPTGNPPAPSAPGDTSPGYYTNRDADGSFAGGGICLTCHVNAQTKNTTDQKTYTGDPGQTSQIVAAAGDFSASAHAFAVGGQIANGNSPFSVACAKCHSGSSTRYQNGTYRFELHTSTNRRLLSPLGITAPGDPLAQNFCFRCHSRTTDANPGGGPAKTVANRDYYDQADMSAGSQLLFNEFTAASTSSHPVTSAGAGALHDPVEGTVAVDGSLSGSNRHVQCEDCHSPHSALRPGDSGTATGSTPTSLTDSTKSGRWLANQWSGYKLMITGGAGEGQTQTVTGNTTTGTLNVASWNVAAGTPVSGSGYRISRQGDNAVSGATKGVRGVTVTPGTVYHAGSATFKDGTTTVYSGASGGIVTTASTGTTVTSAIMNWTTNRWSGYVMRVVVGAQAGQVRNITANAQTTLTISAAITLAQGDLFVIARSTGTDVPVWSSAMVGGHIRNELDRDGRWYRITAITTVDATNRVYSATITPSYGSGAFASGSALSDTRMTAYTTAPTSQWYMDYGTLYSISSVTFAATTSATKEHEICLKCHSSWALDFGSSSTATGGPPNVPSGHQDGSAVPETNVALDFNTGQLSYHPVFAPGLNQPTGVPYAGWNTNAAYTRVDNTGVSSTFGLSNTFTTGWYKESLLQCSDCHASDTPSDPLGPHASGKKWILRGLDTTVSWVRRNSTGTGWETITNNQMPSTPATEARNFCLNCHRWDVYGYIGLAGDAPASVLSRVPHDVSGNNNTYASGGLPRSGIVCNNCHGGDRIGGAHGSSRRKFPFKYDPSTDLNRQNAITAVPASYSGKRLLNGAYWYGVTRATTSSAVTCWGKGGTDTVSLCAHGHENTGGNTAQYSYDDAADP